MVSKEQNISCRSTYKQHIMFQSNIFSFACVVFKKPGKGDAVTFLNAIFGISKCRT